MRLAMLYIFLLLITLSISVPLNNSWQNYSENFAKLSISISQDTFCLLILNQRKNLIAKKITMNFVLIIYLNIREFWINRHKSNMLEVNEESDSNSILNQSFQCYSFRKFSFTQECILRHLVQPRLSWW